MSAQARKVRGRRTADLVAVTRAAVHRLALAGKPMKEIAAEVGMSPAYVTQIAHSFGFTSEYITAAERAAVLEKRRAAA